MDGAGVEEGVQTSPRLALLQTDMPDTELQEGHAVLGAEYCSGYNDEFGKWNHGFYCPNGEEHTLYCCGGHTHKYCCERQEQPQHDDISSLPLLLGVILGAAAAITIVTLVSCCFCSCCVLYKKRQPNTNGGSLYRLQCSTGSAVANMYSFSNQTSITTPMDTTVLVDLESVNTAETRERLGMSYSHTFSRPVLSPKTIKHTDKFEPILEGAETRLRPPEQPPPYDSSGSFSQEQLNDAKTSSNSSFIQCSSALTVSARRPATVPEEVSSVLSSSGTSEDTGGGSSSLSTAGPLTVPVSSNKSSREEVLYHSTKF